MNTLLNRKKIYYLFSFLLIISLNGCNSHNKKSIVKSKVVRESHIKTDKVNFVNEEHIMVLNLEHPNAQADTEDLHQVGSDCYLFKPTKDLNHILLDIDETTHIGFISIKNMSTLESVTFFPEETDTFYSFIAHQEYEYCLTHTGRIEENQTLFIHFDIDENNLDEKSKSANDDAINRLKMHKDCPNCDLSDADLDHMDLSDLNLSGAKMKRANLYGANLTHANLDGTYLSDVLISYATFDHTNINYNRFSFKTIKGASFDSVTFPNNYTFDASLTYEDINFNNVDFSGITMQNIEFKGNTTFKHAIFYNTKIYASKFRELSLRGADFRGAEIDNHTSFYKADLRDISKTSFNVLENSGASLTKSIITNSGDGPHKTLYEDLGHIEFYSKYNCEGSHTTINSYHYYNKNCKDSHHCENDTMKSALFYPHTRKNIILKLYDDPDGKTDMGWGRGYEDYIIIKRNNDEIKKPFCVSGFEHDTTDKDSDQGFSLNYHKATFPNLSNLTGHVSHIKLIKE